MKTRSSTKGSARSAEPASESPQIRISDQLLHQLRCIQRNSTDTADTRVAADLTDLVDEYKRNPEAVREFIKSLRPQAAAA